MKTENWTFIILVFILFPFALNALIEWLDLKSAGSKLPDEVKDVYEENEYKRSLNYHRDTTLFGLLNSFVGIIFLIAVIFLGGFAVLDSYALEIAGREDQVVRGLVFTSLFFAISYVANLPATLYSTFVLEEKYGFNKITLKTWLLDQVKGFGLGTLIGLPFLALLTYIFSFAKQYENAWLGAWLFIVVFQIIMMYLSPLLMGLFNKFEALKDDGLKNMIESYAQKHGFEMEGVYQMDGSKRSSKANAFFTGFGKFKKIVLFL